MSFQQEWVGLSDRTEEVQDLVNQVAKVTGSGIFTAEELYERNNWGITTNAALCSALLKMKELGYPISHDEILSERNKRVSSPSGEPGIHEGDIDDTTIVQKKPESIVTRQVLWFINNGDNQEIRLKAKEQRERALLELYLEHVELTGETYFPQLQQLLESEWKFGFSGNDEYDD